VKGKDVLELGCGAAQWSILLARLGARPVGIDNSERQLEHARQALAAAGLDFPLIHAAAESIPLPDESFDIVFDDHGANRFADPYQWVPEAGRLLRPGGLLAFSGSTPFEVMCWNEPADRMDAELHTRLLRPAPRRGSGRARAVSSSRTASGSAFSAPTASKSRTCGRSSPLKARVTYRAAEETEWARSWPMEQIWIVRKEA
jgi:ubiquinone/menaquinone biosynthesis C-methylase UbiE